jgi:hypothetical protein
VLAAGKVVFGMAYFCSRILSQVGCVYGVRGQ